MKGNTSERQYKNNNKENARWRRSHKRNNKTNIHQQRQKYKEMKEKSETLKKNYI